jgi:dipeptide/tripeptide permease
VFHGVENQAKTLELSSMSKEVENQPNVLGHPAGLYTLFFAEMWERFSYYGMRALLIFYMTKGLLAMSDAQSSTIYGAYTALVYMTPFIGGMLADRILGKRIAVVLGGTLMAAGHLLMTYESEWPFYFALALLIAGNGFFKPNISTMVGTLYASKDGRRDNGFNIFYMGINLGAAISPLLCGYIGEVYGWHYGFGLATIGMMVGLAVFIMPNMVSATLIMIAAIATSYALFVFRPDNLAAIGLNILVAVCLIAAAIIACIAIKRGGLPDWAGRRPTNTDSRHDWKVYVGTAISIPIFALLVSGFAPFMPAEKAEVTVEETRTEIENMITRFQLAPEIASDVRSLPIVVPASSRDGVSLLPASIYQGTKTLGVDQPDTIGRTLVSAIKSKDGSRTLAEAGEPLLETVLQQLRSEGISEVVVLKKSSEITGLGKVGSTFLKNIGKPAGLVLISLGVIALGYLFIEIFRLPWLLRDRMLAALVLIFFQLVFFAFFEQAGNSLNVFTDRNVARVTANSTVTQDMVGQTIRFQPTQFQLGYTHNGQAFTIKELDQLRSTMQRLPQHQAFEVAWTLDESHVGMQIGERRAELPASIFQALNAIFILLFALVFNVVWTWLEGKGYNPSAPVKFALGLVQVGLGFYALVIGAGFANEQGMISVWWLVLAYYLHTTGELCLSPVGLSAMTKLSAKHLVSTLMGTWFLATAFSQYVAGIISELAGVDESALENGFPSPTETLKTSTLVFEQVAYVAIACGVLCLILSPLISYWMHSNVADTDDSAQ